MTSGGRIRSRWLDACALAVTALSLILTLSYLTTDLNYDEAVYLGLARRIVDVGVPLRRTFDDFTQLRLFRDSPPLAIYVASVTQRFAPANPIPARLLHIALFVVPTMLLVWLVARQRFGAIAGLAAALALLASGNYVNDSHYVQLDVPLGLLALVTLVSFERATARRAHAGRWAALAAAALFAATWTKYQAICIAVAIAAFSAVTVVREGRGAVRRLAWPFLLQIAAGATALATLALYYLHFGTPGDMDASLLANLGRMSAGSTGGSALLHAVLDAATRSVTWMGPVLVLAALISPLSARGRELTTLLAAYVLATLLFNIAVFRMPGSGSYYLIAAVPAAALLAGAAAASLADVVPPRQALAVVVVAAGIQFASAPPRLYVPPYVNRTRLAASFIEAQGMPQAGVLATTRGIEYYTGNPVGVIRWMSRDALMESLTGAGPNHVEFVVIVSSGAPLGVEAFQTEWAEALREHFVDADAGIAGVRIYRRKPVG